MQGRRRFGAACRLLIRGVMHRRGVAALTVIVAIAASAAAAVAPTYRAAAAVSALRARMTAAPANDAGVEVAASSVPSGSPDVVLATLTPRLPLSVTEIRGLTVGGNSTQLQVPGDLTEYAGLEWRQDDCAHVVFTAGRCPTGLNEIALPANSAAALSAKLGGPIVASNLDRPAFGEVTDINDEVVRASPSLNAASYDLHDTVVGLFDVPQSQSTYWFGQDIGSAIISPDGTQVATVTALVPRAALERLPAPFRANVVVDQVFDWSHATPTDVARVQRAVHQLKSESARNISVLTGVPALLRADSRDRSQLSQLVTLAQLQLLLLVGLVLIAILAASMDRRRAELVIATLQGRRPASTALSIAAEPVLLLAIGVVPGLLVSVPLAAFASHLWLRPGTPVHLTLSALVGALIVTVVAAIVTVALGFVAASRSLGDQLAEDARSAGGRGGAWIDIVAITLAAAGLVELFSSNSSTSSTPWSLLAPSLCGLAAGLALGRIVPALLRPAIRSTAESTELGKFLAIRELRRDRAAWRVTAMVALALSLLTFAVTVSRGASSDRVDRAGLIVGAPRVVTVLLPPGKSLLSAVDSANPSGKWAMAAELLEPLGSSAQRTLAVDTTRLSAVAGWNRRIDGYTLSGIKKLLHVPPSVAHLALPLLTAGDVEGSTFALNNQPLRRAQAYNTSVLPELLGQGALADLTSLISVAKPIPASGLGTSQLVDQVWLGQRAPPSALARLRAQGLTVSSVTSRAQVEQTLERSAQTAGLSGYLAVALLIGTSVSALSRQRTETLALSSAGVSRATVVRGRAGAAAVRLGLAGIVALACGIVTAHLSAHLVPQTASGAVPSALLPLPPFPALVAVVVTLVPALLAELAIAIYAAQRTDAASLRAALP